MRLPCPACGFLTVPEAYYGSFNVCEVCAWEDDGVQLANPACGGGANSDCLIDAQTEALVRFPIERADAFPIRRDSVWRPLSDDEIQIALREREAACWRNKAIEDPAAAYWNKPTTRT